MNIIKETEFSPIHLGAGDTLTVSCTDKDGERTTISTFAADKSYVFNKTIVYSVDSIKDMTDCLLIAMGNKFEK